MAFAPGDYNGFYASDFLALQGYSVAVQDFNA